MSRPGSGNQQKYIKQYASSVIDFSSQYGSENPRSVSYSVSNIIGEPRIFPAYGDFTQAAVFRTYGTWWNSYTFSKINKSRPKSKSFLGKDYVDLLFEEAVYPCAIAIYETYNPGAVVRILALTENPGEKGRPIPLPLKSDCCSWEVLWECNSLEDNLPNPPDESRMFAPALRGARYLTRIVRLEFCSTHLHYYTEIDAVELTGTSMHWTSSPVDCPALLINSLRISSEENAISKRELPVEEYSNGYFDLLPRELICYIFSFLPLPDLCRCSIVCQLFQELSYDPSQFSIIDLSNSWHMINDNALSSIVAHCNSASDGLVDEIKVPVSPQVQVVDLSWCGGGGIVSKGCLVAFIEKCGSNLLTHLTFSSSPAVSDETLRNIVKFCPNLLHLDIQSCNSMSSEGLRVLHNLTKLTYLNLYRTLIDDAGIICIIHSNPTLQYLNLGSCSKLQDYDRVLQELSGSCIDLKSLDCWRAKSLTSFGLEALLSSCKKLSELDFGWCGGLQSATGCFRMLASHCPELIQLYVTANRTISDVEVNFLAEFCPKLEKLDILGTRLVSVAAVKNLLHSCKNLQFIDVSFCSAFTKQVVASLQAQFPYVAIKRSFQDDT